MIGCNCITKVLLADTKIKSKMPLLAVQIDNNFISLNLYEQGQLSFSRFASIDAADYGYSDDYVFEAVNENIFRMLQFHRSRNTGESIENVIFYGDTHEYVRLTDELEKLDLKTSLINVPPQIHGHENLEFSLYANAIGAMFKRNREIEKINLLETDLGTAVKNKIKHNESSGNMIMLCALIGSLAIAGGTWAFFHLKDKGIQKDIKKCQDYINSPDTKQKEKHHAYLTQLRETVNSYYTKMKNADDAFQSQPALTGEAYDEIEKILDKTCEDKKLEFNEISTPTYKDGTISFKVTCDGSKDDMSQKLPADFIKNLVDSPMFKSASYGGYKLDKIKDPEKNDEEVERISFNAAVKLVSEKSAYQPVESADNKEEAEG
jgi:type IV pilus assembly protein PilM